MTFQVGFGEFLVLEKWEFLFRKSCEMCHFMLENCKPKGLQGPSNVERPRIPHYHHHCVIGEISSSCQVRDEFGNDLPDQGISEKLGELKKTVC